MLYVEGDFMCGRFLLDSEIRELIIQYKIEKQDIESFNKGDFYPSSHAPIILEEEFRTIKEAKWGFPLRGSSKPVINARAESIKERPMFNSSFYSRRCIIPANSFYEWSSEKDGKKVKYRIRSKSERLLSLGGIYNLTVDENFNELMSFVVITREAQDDMGRIHTRMPLIIECGNTDIWLKHNISEKYLDNLLGFSSPVELNIEKCQDNISKHSYEQLKMF